MGIELTDRDVSECVGDALDQAVDLTMRSLSDRADLSTTAATTLNRLEREGPFRLTSLAATEGVSQPSMTQLIQRLERGGLVTRLPDPDDGRAALIGITDAGRALLDQRRGMRRERLAVLVAALTAEEQCALVNAARVAFPILRRLTAEADRAEVRATGTGTAAPRPAP